MDDLAARTATLRLQAIVAGRVRLGRLDDRRRRGVPSARCPLSAARTNPPDFRKPEPHLDAFRRQDRPRHRSFQRHRLGDRQTPRRREVPRPVSSPAATATSSRSSLPSAGLHGDPRRRRDRQRRRTAGDARRDPSGPRGPRPDRPARRLLRRRHSDAARADAKGEAVDNMIRVNYLGVVYAIEESSPRWSSLEDRPHCRDLEPGRLQGDSRRVSLLLQQGGRELVSRRAPHPASAARHRRDDDLSRLHEDSDDRRQRQSDAGPDVGGGGGRPDRPCPGAARQRLRLPLADEPPDPQPPLDCPTGWCGCSSASTPATDRCRRSENRMSFSVRRMGLLTRPPTSHLAEQSRLSSLSAGDGSGDPSYATGPYPIVNIRIFGTDPAAFPAFPSHCRFKMERSRRVL